jgi:hypothetical protein
MFHQIKRMKKLIFSLVGSACLLTVLISADFRSIPRLVQKKEQPKPTVVCTGYTIIEFDKAINCNGDTIRLVRNYGYAERVR